MRVQARTILSLALLGILAFAGCSSDSDNGGGSTPCPVSSRSYKGHMSDLDSNNFVCVYTAAVGTRLDDCQTCHKAGQVMRGSQASSLNPCAYCHLINYPDTTITSGAPVTYQDTLNPYGLAYKGAGRSVAAVRSIEGADSDGDTFGNTVEVVDLRYPGDPDSKPGQPFAPSITLTWAQINALPQYEEFLQLNANRQQFDEYANYGGVKMMDVLPVGLDLTNATSITVFAPDGFTVDVPIENLGSPYPLGIFYPGLDPGSFADPNQGFVQYPPADQIPPGLSTGSTIPGVPWLLLATTHNRTLLQESYLDPVAGKIEGEGPYRLIVPQLTPGSPDRGSKYSPTTYGDGWDYDSHKDHNAGNCTKGAVAIRINPMPEGYEEFDWQNGGWSLISDKKFIIYGNGITQ